MNWALSAEERRALRSLTNSEGWKIFSARLREVELEAKEFLIAAEHPDDWRRRKGFVEGISQVSNLVGSLLTVDEVGGIEAWLSKELKEQAQEVQELLGREDKAVERAMEELRRQTQVRLPEEQLQERRQAPQRARRAYL